VESSDPRELRLALLSCAAVEFAEVWLSVNGGASMALLKSGERALCFFVRHHGDSGFTSRRPASEAKRGTRAELEFRIGRGESCRFPEEWTVPLFVALRAADEFLRTGERPPQIPWHDDATVPPAPRTTQKRRARKS
jgi:hypothetical protein